MKQYQKYIKKAKKFKIKDAKIISAKSIVSAKWVRMKCQFGCGGFGKRLTCPPYSPTPEQTGKMLADYKYALLIHGDEYTDIRKTVYMLEREIFLDGYYKAYGMGSGPCNLCSKCPEFCSHAEKARPSMEASGIDVFKTAQTNGFPIKVLKSTDCKGNYFGVVLIE